MQILTTVSMECHIVKEQDYAIMYHNGYLNLYVKKIVIAWMEINTKQQRKDYLTEKQDWENQPSFKQSDLYVIPEGLVYDILSNIAM